MRALSSFVALFLLIAPASSDAQETTTDGEMPNALMCAETAAEIRGGSAGPDTSVGDFLENYFLLSDPRNLCRSDKLARVGAYIPANGRCYLLKGVDTGEPDLPLACQEAYETAADGSRKVAQIRCSGWSRTIEAAADGSFRLSMATGPILAKPGQSTDARRVSTGTCRRF